MHRRRVKEYDDYVFSLELALSKASGRSEDEVRQVLNETEKVFNQSIDSTLVIPENWGATQELARISYCISRLVQPKVVVETGVGRGVTSLFILNALRRNGSGELYSIDLPMPGAIDQTGILVPSDLRSKWTLILGIGVREMKNLRRSLKSIDFFIHDSDHSYGNQVAEYEVALNWLSPGGILVSDDVLNDSLIDIANKHDCDLMIVRPSCPHYEGHRLGVIAK